MWHVAAQALLTKKTVLSAWIGAGLVVALAIDPTVLAAAIVTVITALSGAAVIIIGALGKMKKELLDAQAAATSRLETIEHHVDGMASAAVAKKTADEELNRTKKTADDDTIMSLKAQLNEANRRAELLAQSQAVAVAGSLIAAPIVTPISVPQTSGPPAKLPQTSTLLKRIEENTADTAENTKRTDDNVQNMKDDAKK